jgi:hypothetical protein
MAIDQITTGVIKDDAVTGAKLENNPTIAGTLGVTGVATMTARSIHSAGITIADNGNIGSASDLDAIAIAANGNVTISQALTVTGDLTVNGTNTTVNATNLQIDDKQIELAHSPSGSEGNDASIDGGGIILKSSDSDKSISWANADDAWTFNQHIFPSADNASDLGSAAKRWRNIYTGDLHLANDRGNWTVIEEENYLTLRNNKTDKVYKLVMEEIA